MKRIRYPRQAAEYVILLICLLLFCAALEYIAALVGLPHGLRLVVFRLLMLAAGIYLIRRLILARDRVFIDEDRIRVMRFGRVICDFSWSEIQEYGTVCPIYYKRWRTEIPTLYFSREPLSDERRMKVALFELCLLYPILKDPDIIAIDFLNEKKWVLEPDQELLSRLPFSVLHRTDLPVIWDKHPFWYADPDGQVHYLDKNTAKSLYKSISTPYMILFFVLLLAAFLSFFLPLVLLGMG